MIYISNKGEKPNSKSSAEVEFSKIEKPNLVIYAFSEEGGSNSKSLIPLDKDYFLNLKYNSKLLSEKHDSFKEEKPDASFKKDALNSKLLIPPEEDYFFNPSRKHKKRKSNPRESLKSLLRNDSSKKEKPHSVIYTLSKEDELNIKSLEILDKDYFFNPNRKHKKEQSNSKSPVLSVKNDSFKKDALNSKLLMPPEEDYFFNPSRKHKKRKSNPRESLKLLVRNDSSKKEIPHSVICTLSKEDELNIKSLEVLNEDYFFNPNRKHKKEKSNSKSPVPSVKIDSFEKEKPDSVIYTLFKEAKSNSISSIALAKDYLLNPNRKHKKDKSDSLKSDSAKKEKSDSVIHTLFEKAKSNSISSIALAKDYFSNLSRKQKKDNSDSLKSDSSKDEKPDARLEKIISNSESSTPLKKDYFFNPNRKKSKISIIYNYK